MIPQKYFPVFARARIQAPHVFTQKLIPQDFFLHVLVLWRGVLSAEATEGGGDKKAWKGVMRWSSCTHQSHGQNLAKNKVHVCKAGDGDDAERMREQIFSRNSPFFQ